VEKHCIILLLIMLCVVSDNIAALLNKQTEASNVAQKVNGIGEYKINRNLNLNKDFLNNKKHFKKELSINSNINSKNVNQSSEYYVNLGADAYNGGYYDLAINYYTKAIQLDPYNTYAYNGRGMVHKKLGNYNQAIADFTDAIEYRPDFVDAYNNRGETYRLVGKYNQGIIDFNIAIQLDSNDDYAYASRGKAYYDSHKYKQAIADYSRATQINPYYADAYYNRGLAYKKFGNQELAIADFNKACTLNKIYCK